METNQTTVQPNQEVVNWISRLLLDLCHDPDSLSIKASVDQKGLLISAYAHSRDLSRLIGKKGKTANAIRELAYMYGAVRGCRVSVKLNGIDDDILS